MIPRMTIPDQVIEQSRGQGGVMSRKQILSCGVSDDVIGRLVRSGRWQRLAQGIYALEPDSWMQRVWAGLLIGGDRAVVGLRAAAKLWNLPYEKGRYEPDNPPIEIYVGETHHVLPSNDKWRFIRSSRSGQLTPRRTSIAQTIVDLARTMTGDQMASLVGQSVGRHRVTPREIQSALKQTGHHPHRTLLAGVVSDTADGVTSALEWHYVHDVERAHGLPKAWRQAKPVAIFTVDNFYEEYGLIVELDSRAYRDAGRVYATESCGTEAKEAVDALRAKYHRGVAAAQDLERDRIHERNGYSTLRFTWADVVDHPCRTASLVASTLAARGWRGALTTCPRCT